MKRLVSSYGFSMVLLSLVLMALSSMVSLTLYLNPVSQVSAATIGKATEQVRQLYFLKSKETIRKMYSFGLSDAYYLERLDALKRRYSNNGYSVKYIDETQLASLPDRSSLFVFDAMDMSDEALATIKSFVRQGGSLVFNYHFAYHNNNLYRGDQAIRDITGLVPAQTASHIRTKGELYLTANVLSPLTATIHPRGSKISIELYDSLPLFTSASLQPDAIVTNWNVTSTLKLTGQQGEPRSVKAEESGALWHGRFGKGNWIYTTLPSYSLYSSADSQALLEQLLIGMAEHSNSVLKVQSFPYLDIDKVVFVSEDTEFKFHSFAAFAELSNRYQVPVTAFLVASLAKKIVNWSARQPKCPIWSLVPIVIPIKKSSVRERTITEGRPVALRRW